MIRRVTPGRAATLLALAPLLVAGAASAEPPRIGDRAPPLEVRSLDGGRAVVPTGHVVVVDFFATWCTACQQAMSALEPTLRAHANRITLVVVDVGEASATVRRFFAHRALPPGAIVLLDPASALADAFGSRRFPTTFLVDPGGVVRHINRGFGPGYGARVSRWLLEMLAPP